MTCAPSAHGLLAIPFAGSRVGPFVTGGRSNGTKPELGCVSRRIVLVRLRSRTTFCSLDSGSTTAGIAGLALPGVRDALTIGPMHLVLGAIVWRGCLLCIGAHADEKDGETKSRPDYRPHGLYR